MLAYVIIFGLLIGACYWILSPLLNEKDHQDGFTPKLEDILEKLKNKKDGVYATIRELEFDLSMGKLSEEDFQILNRQFILEAAGYMKEIDKLDSAKATATMLPDTDLEEEIDQEVTPARTSKSTRKKYIHCTACGEKAAAENRFCTACGSNLHKRHNNYVQEEN